MEKWIAEFDLEDGDMMPEHMELEYKGAKIDFHCRPMGINALPSAQPERIRGRWNKISPAGIYECSVCGQNVMTDDIDVYHYCHGCGADMRGEELDEAD